MNDEQDDQVRFDEQRSAQYVQYDIDDDIQWYTLFCSFKSWFVMSLRMKSR